MKLCSVTKDDLPLYESMFCDPVHMAELGGPQPREKVPEILKKQIEGARSGRSWLYKVVPDFGIDSKFTEVELSMGVGTVGLWTGSWKEEPVTEICWGIAPKYQGNGFGSAAVRMLLHKAIEEGAEKWGKIHVFTSTSNEASNRICKSCGFTWIEETEIDYDDQMLHVHHYILDTTLAKPSPVDIDETPITIS
mmetsp:Transcript_16161/g.27311  ORF Transcript_16161/g.27311 Transcript_16161/m.27311 type:complete len:193 (-) Transcript_16161:1584-2162(-)